MAQEPITAQPLTITNQYAQTFTIPAAIALPTMRPLQFPDLVASTRAWKLYSTNATYPGTFTYNEAQDYVNVTTNSAYATGIELSDWITLPEGSQGATFTLNFNILECSHTGSIYTEVVWLRQDGLTSSSASTITVSAKNMGDTPMNIERSYAVSPNITGMKLRIYTKQNNRSITYGTVQVTCTTQPTNPVWGAGALTDGHMAGFWSTPTMLGEILDNPVSGGGLQPANPQYGTRPINYVAYLTASTRRQVYDEIKRFTALLAVGKLKVSHHGEGWIWDGWLAAPPAVSWLSNDYPSVRLDFTITYTDPYIWQVDWSSQRQLTEYAYAGRETTSGLIRDGAFWSSGSVDFSSISSKYITLRNPGQADSYPIIFFNFGPNTNSTMEPRTTSFWMRYYSLYTSTSESWGIIPLSWDTGYTSWMIDTRTGSLYAGWSMEDGYKSALQAGSLATGHSMKLTAGQSTSLYIYSEDGVGELSILVPQGRI